MEKMNRLMSDADVVEHICSIRSAKQAEDFLNGLSSVKMERVTLKGGYLAPNEAWQSSLLDVSKLSEENKDILLVDRDELMVWFQKAKSRFGPVKEKTFDCFADQSIGSSHRKTESHAADTYFQEPRQIEL